VSLCGASISVPDVHIVNLVKVAGESPDVRQCAWDLDTVHADLYIDVSYLDVCPKTFSSGMIPAVYTLVIAQREEIPAQLSIFVGRIGGCWSRMSGCISR